MVIDLSEIQNALQNMFIEHVPPMQIRKNNESVFEVAGTIEAMQGKSCFLIKKLSPELESEMNTMIQKGVSIYKTNKPD